MNEKEFIKNEPLIFKVCYILGGLFFILNLSELTSEKGDVNFVYPILGFGILILLFIRINRFIKNYE